MSLVKPVGKITWEASTALDVQGYNVYWGAPGETVSYDSAFEDVGNVLEVALPLAGMEGFDGDIPVGIAAYDDAGNMSDLVMVTVPLDVDPPAAPTNVMFVPA